MEISCKKSSSHSDNEDCSPLRLQDVDDDAGRQEVFVTFVCDDTSQLTDSATMTERRRGLRIRQQRPVKVYDIAGDRYIGGRTSDMSSTGLRLELPAWAPFLEGKRLEIHVAP